MPASASPFDVYCTNNVDGTTTCLGWQGGQALTCVSSLGRTTSCSSPSGLKFTCIVDTSGVASCRGAVSERRREGSAQCVVTGDGNLACDEENNQPAPLLETPGLPSSMPNLLPNLNPVIPNTLDLPSVFN
ncbi:MAG: hypothetical protein VKK98_09680 [Cyanobacteriota bacterium]|nr:hypothetical protein [Cyanobacteriota bacterium]